MWTVKLEVAKMRLGDIINVLKKACIYIFTNEKAPYGFWSNGDNADIFELVISVFLVILMSCIVFTFFRDKKRLILIPSGIAFICFFIGFPMMFITGQLWALGFTVYMFNIFVMYSILCGCVLGIEYVIGLIIGKIKERKAQR